MRGSWKIFVVLTCVLAMGGVAYATHGPGHEAVTRIAVIGLPREIPAYFRCGVETIAHCAQDPDLFTRPIGPPELHAQEAPEHYFDLELLDGAELPPTRYEFIDLCAKKGLAPSKIGLLPYAVVEWTQRLTVAFAEHRKYPNDPYIRHKSLVYAGILSHYAQDLTQPLHTTIHWDGRANPDGSSPRSGIHKKVDALLQKVDLDPISAARKLEVAAFDELLPTVIDEIRRSHALVDRVYELESQLPGMEEPLAVGSAVDHFATDRLCAAAELTASLYLTAWENSAKLELPDWYERPQSGVTARSLEDVSPLMFWWGIGAVLVLGVIGIAFAYRSCKDAARKARDSTK